MNLAQKMYGIEQPEPPDKSNMGQKPPMIGGLLSGIINNIPLGNRQNENQYFKSLGSSLRSLVQKADGAAMNPQGQVAGAIDQAPTPIPTPIPTPMPTPTPQPTMPFDPRLGEVTRDYIYDYRPYLEHMDNPPPMYQPSDEMHKILQEVFPEDATRSALVNRFEGFGAYPKPYKNSSGSLVGTYDVGPFMINSGTSRGTKKVTTFDDLMNRFPNQMREAGVVDGAHPDYPGENVNASVFDPLVNANIAKINFNDPGNQQGWWGRWFGLRDNKMKKEHFTPRQSPF